MPKYKGATWGGESRVLENDFMRVEVHNRKTGWAYVEFYTKAGKLMGVLPYLASVQDNAGGPRGNMAAFRRVESQEVKEEHTEDADSLIFDVHALTFAELAKGSFVEFMAPPETPLLHAPNTLLTPHVAFATRESMMLRAQIVFDNLRAWLDGGQDNAVL